MGCYLSKHGRDSNARLFRVFIVNDLGAELNGGKIEVSQSDLILYLKGKEPIRWPLRCLRRYGFDEELFSFESGRRCPTGSGVYAFKCRRAAELFNLVQEFIQNVGQTSHLRPSHLTATGTGRQSSRPSSLVESREPNGPFMSSNARVAFIPSGERLYINGIDDVALNGNDLDVEISQQPNYIYVGANGEIKEKSVVIVQRSDSVTNDMTGLTRVSVLRQRSVDQNYANLDGCINGNPHSLVMNPNSVCPPSVVYTSDPGELNYIEIDMNNTGPNDTDSANGVSSSVTSVSYTTPKGTTSYAMIDFNRTVALAKPVSDDGEGVRKTRHNITIT